MSRTPRLSVEQAARVTRRHFRRSGKKTLGNCVFADLKEFRRTDSDFSRHKLRLREIENVVVSRYGRTIPETDDPSIVEAAAFALNAHCYVTGDDLERRLRDWCSMWAPWANIRAGDIIRPILNALVNRRHDLKADAVAQLLAVSFAERQTLKLNTIGACDIPARVRKTLVRKAKRERDRLRQAAIRRQAGRLDRSSYEGQSLSRTKPWLAEGISRRTWERRRASVASPSRLDVLSATGDTLASNPAEVRHIGLTSMSAQSSNQRSAAFGTGHTFPHGPIGTGSANDDTEPLDVSDTLVRVGGVR